MNELLKIQHKLIPQVFEMMEKRYSILRQIYLNETVGRRSLANIMGLSERIVRSETEILKDQGLINILPSGMNITEEGIELLDDLKDIMNEIMGLSTLEDKLKSKLGIRDVMLVPGDYEKNKNVLIDVARSASNYFTSVLKENDIVSITGGVTMLTFCKNIKSDKKFKDVIVVPARGSLGAHIETQSNTVVSICGKRLGSNYELLNLPDKLSEESLNMLTNEPEIKRTLDLIDKSDIVIFGVGRADEMLERRNLPKEDIAEILSRGAVGEAFGYYFNKDGEIVYKLNTIGIDLDRFKQVRDSIVIFSGTKKAEAFLAISKINKNLILVTDEASAEKLLELAEKEKQ